MTSQARHAVGGAERTHSGPDIWCEDLVRIHTTEGVEVQALQSRYAFLTETHAARLVRCYGTEAAKLLGDAISLADLGRHFGATLYEVEVRWLMNEEWANTAEDVLWRRTKQGLFLSPPEAESLGDYMKGA